MNIALDLQVCQSREFRGIGRYSLDFAKAVMNSAAALSHEKFAILSSVHRERHAQIVAELGLPITQYRFVGSQFDSPLLNQLHGSCGVDVVHDSHLFEYPEKFALNFNPDTARRVYTATFYDLIPMRMPVKYLADKAVRDNYYRHVESLKRRDLLFAISEAARRDGIDLLGMSADRVVNISTGVDEKRFFARRLSGQERTDLYARFGISRDFLLYTTGFDPRKNLFRFVQAYASLPQRLRTRYQLVIVCPRTEWSEPLIADICRKAGLVDGRDVIFTGFVQDDDLVSLYRATKLFVFPSLYEGFGLPIVEAVRCGAPAIGSDCSSIVELLPDRRTRFDPESTEDIANHIVMALESPSGLEQVQAAELKHVGRYTWDNVAKTAWTAWEDAAVRKNRAKKVRSYFSWLIPEWRPSPIETPQATRILFDISWWINANITTGIQRVVSKIAASFRKRTDGFVYQAVALKDGKLLNCIYDEQAGRYRYADEWKCQPRDILLMLDSSWEWREPFLPFFEEVKSQGGSIYSVVYDILPVLHPELFDQGIRTIFPLWLKHASHHVDGIVCISKSVGAEYCEYAGTHADVLPVGKQFLIGHFYLGADFMTKKATPSGNVEFAFPDSARVVLSVGTIEPRKNHAYMLAVMEKVLSQDANTCWVIVGQRGWLMEEWTEKLQRHPLFGKRIFYYPRANDATLAALYDRSEFLLNLSKGEGYGLPLIEAGEKGKRVICSDIPVFHEIDRFGYDYCPLDDALRAAAVVVRALANGTQVRTGVKATTSRFSWDDSAKMLLGCIVGNRWDRVMTINKPLSREYEHRIGGAGLKLDETYNFSTPCDTDYVVGSGFSPREPWGVWCAGKQNEITIELPSAGKCLMLRFTAQCFGTATENVSVILGKRELAKWSVKDSSPAEYELDCTALPREKELDLCFVPDGTTRPCDVVSGNTDARELSLGFISMKLIEI